MPLVSFIIPTYNTEKYIKATVYSILNQSYEDIEIIAVNDGSTDKSLEILNDIENNDNRLKIINTKNQGFLQQEIQALIMLTVNGYILLTVMICFSLTHYLFC